MLKPSRKLFRLVGLLFPLLYLFTSRDVVLVFTALVFSILLVLEWTRFRRPGVNDFLFRYLSAILREEEREQVTTTTWFVYASLLLALLLNRELAATAWLFALFGDMAAQVVGIRYGRIRVLSKSLEGSLACLVTCLILGLVASTFLRLRPPVVLLGAVVATVVEAAPLPLDDNFTMPLFTGVTMALAQLFLEGPV